MKYGKIFDEWYDRVCAFGYDIVCGIYLRLLTLFKEDLLTEHEKYLWILLIPYFFIDKLHVTGHVNTLCIFETGIFHPKIDKFDGILYNVMSKINDQIAEQLWGILINKFKFIFKSLSMPKAKLLSFLVREWYNHKHKQKLSKNKLYYDDNLQNFTKLRNLQNYKINSNININNNNNNNNININNDNVESISKDSLIQNRGNKLDNIKRAHFCNEINVPYKSIFSKKKHHWEVRFEFVESMESITRTWKIPVKI